MRVFGGSCCLLASYCTLLNTLRILHVTMGIKEAIYYRLMSVYFMEMAVPRFPINRRFSMVCSAFLFLVNAACHKDTSEWLLSGAV